MKELISLQMLDDLSMSSFAAGNVKSDGTLECFNLIKCMYQGLHNVSECVDAVSDKVSI